MVHPKVIQGGHSIEEFIFVFVFLLQPLPSPTEVQYVEAYASAAAKKVNRLYDAKFMFNIFIYGK